MVRPPRLGGNKKTGVFASRSGFRPNPIGMSAVMLEDIIIDKSSVRLLLKGIDLLDQTPVLDIKPYLTYSDSIPDAVSGYAPCAPDLKYQVTFSDLALSQCGVHEKKHPGISLFISELLTNDPRPAYYTETLEPKTYGTVIFDVDLKWQVSGNTVTVISLNKKMENKQADDTNYSETGAT